MKHGVSSYILSTWHVIAWFRFPAMVSYTVIYLWFGTKHDVIGTSVGIPTLVLHIHTTLHWSHQDVKPINHPFLLYCAITSHFESFI